MGTRDYPEITKKTRKLLKKWKTQEVDVNKLFYRKIGIADVAALEIKKEHYESLHEIAKSGRGGFFIQLDVLTQKHESGKLDFYLKVFIRSFIPETIEFVLEYKKHKKWMQSLFDNKMMILDYNLAKISDSTGLTVSITGNPEAMTMLREVFYGSLKPHAEGKPVRDPLDSRHHHQEYMRYGDDRGRY